MPTMTHEQKINYLRIALGICEVKADLRTVDLICKLYELIKRKKGKTSIEDTVDVFCDIKERYPEIEVKAVKNTPDPNNGETVNNQMAKKKNDLR